MAKKTKVQECIEVGAGIELADITDAEWNKMKVLAAEILKSGQTGGCILRSAVCAFVEFLVEQEEKVYIPADKSKTH